MSAYSRNLTSHVCCWANHFPLIADVVCESSLFSPSSSCETTAAAVCDVCWKRRSERRDIIGEIFETEVKYGRDLRIVLEEFHRPMLVAGLLTSDQLAGIFLNTDELIQVRHDRAQQSI